MVSIACKHPITPAVAPRIPKVSHDWLTAWLVGHETFQAPCFGRIKHRYVAFDGDCGAKNIGNMQLYAGTVNDVTGYHII